MRTLALMLMLVPGLVLAQESPPPAPAPAQAPAAPAKKPSQSAVYKWVDDQGVVHYTDKPPTDGAQPAKLPPLQTYKEGTTPNLRKFEKPGAPATTQGAAQIDIVTPAHDETFRERTVPIAVMVTPQLKAGQKLIYLLDGVPASAPTTQTSYALTEVDRGTHTVSVTVVDEAGNQYGSSPSVTVHVKPPIVDNPGGKKPSKPPNKPKP